MFLPNAAAYVRACSERLLAWASYESGNGWALLRWSWPELVGGVEDLVFFSGQESLDFLLEAFRSEVEHTYPVRRHAISIS